MTKKNKKVWKIVIFILIIIWLLYLLIKYKKTEINRKFKGKIRLWINNKREALNLYGHISM